MAGSNRAQRVTMPKQPKWYDDWTTQIELFPAMYSEAFDSVPGAVPKNKDHMEIELFRNLINCKTVVLNGGQIMDNWNMLCLLHQEGFQKVCEQGCVVYSPYGTLDKPSDYLKSRLNPEGSFLFSSFRGFNVRDVGDAALRTREAVRNALEENAPFFRLKQKLPAMNEEDQSKLEQLYEGYRIADEVFSPERSAMFHQDPSIRSKKNTIRFWTSNPEIQVGFSILQGIGSYLEALAEDLQISPDPERKLLHSELCRILEQAKDSAAEAARRGENTNTRTFCYENLWELLRQEPEELRRLFFELVDLAYHMQIGLRCSNSITLTIGDQRLLLRNRIRPKEANPTLGVDYNLLLYITELEDPYRREHCWEDFYLTLQDRRSQEVARLREKWPQERVLEEKNKDGVVTVECYSDRKNQSYEVTGLVCRTGSGEAERTLEVTGDRSAEEKAALLDGFLTLNDESALKR